MVIASSTITTINGRARRGISNMRCRTSYQACHYSIRVGERRGSGNRIVDRDCKSFGGEQEHGGKSEGRLSERVGRAEDQPEGETGEKRHGGGTDKENLSGQVQTFTPQAE